MAGMFRVKGLDTIGRFLEAFPKNLRDGAMRSGVTASAAVFRDDARRRAPSKTGKLRKAIKSGSSRVNQDGSVSARVRLEGPHAYLGLFHEYGVRPHLIRVSEEKLAEVNARLKPLKNGRQRSRQTLTKWANRMEREGSLVIGDKFVGPVVQHPGHPSHPFLRPAFDTKGEEAADAFRDKIRAYLKARTGITLPDVAGGD